MLRIAQHNKGQDILSYIQCPKPQGHDGGPSAIDEAALERMLVSIIEKYPKFAATVSIESPEPEEPPKQTVPAARPWENAMGNDALRAITDTLAAFQTG